MTTLDALNQRITDLTELLRQHHRNLQRLKLQESQYGIEVPLHLVNQIKAQEERIEQLEIELAQLLKQKEVAKKEQIRAKELLEAPTIHIANFYGLPKDLPAETLRIDHSHEFQARPRVVPAPEQWQTGLLPGLLGLSGQMGRTGLIRLQGSCSLSTAFAFGYVFPNVGGRRLAIDQTIKGQTTTWFSDEAPPPGAPSAQFVRKQSGLNPVQQDGLVIVHIATPNTTLTGTVAEVGHFLQEGAPFQQLVSENPAQVIPNTVKGVLVLAAQATTQGEPLQGWAAATLAQNSGQILASFIEVVAPERLRLFMACPFGLAAFLGHFWNQLGVPIQCYEYLRRNQYAPSFLLE